MTDPSAKKRRNLTNAQPLAQRCLEVYHGATAAALATIDMLLGCG